MPKSDGQIKQFFRRIIRDPAIMNGQPFIKKKKIPVKDVTDLMKKGLKDSQIRLKFPSLSEPDLNLCRAYRARFMRGTLSKEFNRVTKQNVFMLDENIPCGLLYDTVRLFGRSSHVLADGLFGANNSDEKNIWAHMVEKKYQAILTADSDFTRISNKHRRWMIEKYGSIAACPEHLPVVIHVMRNCSREKTLSLLEKHQDDILAFIRENDSGHVELSDAGFIRMRPDTETEKAVRANIAYQKNQKQAQPEHAP